MGFFSSIKATLANKSTGSTATTKPATNKSTTAASVTGIISGVAAAIAAAGAKAVTSTTKKPTTPAKKPAQTTPPKQPAQPAPPPYQPPDTDIVTWSGNGGISFFVKPNKIQGVSELNIEASANIEEKEENSEKFAKKKTNGSIQITIRAYLNAFLGADVQETANKAIEAARKGESGYFYSYGKKLFSNQFMMTEAKATNILMSGTGAWVSCELNLTLKQSSKADGSVQPTGGGQQGGGGGKYYKVQISGMSELKVWATSVQGAVTKACGANYTGYVSVDGSSHYVYKGKIDDARIKDTKKDTVKAADSIKTTNDAKKQSQSVLNNSKRTTVGKTGGKTPVIRSGVSVAFD